MNLEVLSGYTEATELKQQLKRNKFSHVREFIQFIYDLFIIALKLGNNFKEKSVF